MAEVPQGDIAQVDRVKELLTVVAVPSTAVGAVVDSHDVSFASENQI